MLERKRERTNKSEREGERANKRKREREREKANKREREREQTREREKKLLVATILHDVNYSFNFSFKLTQKERTNIVEAPP